MYAIFPFILDLMSWGRHETKDACNDDSRLYVNNH